MYFDTFGFDLQVLKNIPQLGYVISAGGSVLQCMTNLKWETDVDLYCCTKKTEQVLKDFFKTRFFLFSLISTWVKLSNIKILTH